MMMLMSGKSNRERDRERERESERLECYVVFSVSVSDVSSSVGIRNTRLSERTDYA